MNRFRLSPLAEEALEDIIAYTITTHGEAQAIKYRDALFARLEGLAARQPPHGRSCKALVGEAAPDGLFYVRQGSHYIVYRTIEGDIAVVDFIHEKRDLPALVRSLDADE